MKKPTGEEVNKWIVKCLGGLIYLSNFRDIVNSGSIFISIIVGVVLLIPYHILINQLWNPRITITLIKEDDDDE